MENLKIRVMTEQESKEAQELFFELGFKWNSGGNEYFHISSGEILAYSRGVLFQAGDESGKEITLPQLRDKVVLHRNDAVDATHIRVRDEKIYLKSSEGRIYHMLDCEWVLSTWENSQLEPQLKPIKREKQMENLISGKEALIALANGEDVECFSRFRNDWVSVFSFHPSLKVMANSEIDPENKFRLKPRTIKIGDVDVPAPFEPKHGGEYFFIDPVNSNVGYSSDWYERKNEHACQTQFGAWRTEEEIKQVVAALRKLMGVEA